MAEIEGCLPDDSTRVAKLLEQWARGNQGALGAVVPLVYRELRRIAHYYLASERGDHTLQSTALVNEAFLRMLGDRPVAMRNRSHFVAVAARLMRQILVDHARKRQAEKRDGGIRVELSAFSGVSNDSYAQLVALDDALEALKQVDERMAQIVDMKFFGGLSAPAISEVLGISPRTVDRDWATASLWLHRQMSQTPSL